MRKGQRRKARCADPAHVAEGRYKNGACRACGRIWRETHRDYARDKGREWRAANREKNTERVRVWKAANPEKVKARLAVNREKRNARNRVRRAANREKINAGLRAQRAANPEKARERDRARRAADLKNTERVRVWKAANREKLKEQDRIWRAAHPENGRIQCSRRRARKAGVPCEPFDREAHLASFGPFCYYCWRLIWPLAKDWRRLRTEDHIVAITYDGPDAPWNIVPACQSCNSSKRDRWRLPPAEALLASPVEFQREWADYAAA